MGRSIFTLLLITTLLACPLRCWSHGLPAAEAASIQAACGDCCESTTDESSPSQCPDGDCDCVDCICHGALHEFGADPDLMLEHCVNHFRVVIDLQPQPDGPERINAASADRLPYRSGIAMRLAHRSLLI